MPATIKIDQPFVLDDFSSGMIDDISVSDALMPKNAVRKGVNVRFDRPRGNISQRLGTTQVGSGTVNGVNTVLGLHNLRLTQTSYNQLLAASHGQIMHLVGSTWTLDVAGLNQSNDVNFITYLDRVAYMNGVDPVQSWDGASAWVGSGGPLDVGNWPARNKFAAVMNGRVFTAGDSSAPCRLFKSSIVASNAISWTSGNGYVDVDPNDGSGSITSIRGNARLILVFKDRSLFRYDDTDLQRIGFVGTPSHKSVFTDDNGVTYFFGQGVNTTGIYATTGGYPKKLSRPIQKWLEAIDPTYYSSIAGYTDGTKCFWSVGSLTVDGTTYTNSWLVYTISDKTWEVRNYPTRYTVFAQYITSGSAITTVGGGTDGLVQTIDSGTTDNGTPISGECELSPFIFSLYPVAGRKSMSSKRGEVKKLVELMTFTKDYQGLRLMMAVDRGPWLELGAIEKKDQRFINLPDDLKGNTFHAKITFVNSGVPFVFEGIDYYNVVTEGYSEDI